MAERAKVRGITPYLTVGNGKAAAEFYARVLGAETSFLREAEDGGVAHMTLSVNEGVLMLSDSPDWGRWGSMPRSPHSAVGWLAVETDDCDATYAAAVAAGATAVLPPEDTPWGDRYARFRDPFGQVWSISSPARKIG